MPPPPRQKPPVSSRAKAAGAWAELQQATRATQQARLTQFVRASAARAAANAARYRLQLRTAHLAAPQDATRKYAAHLRQPLSPPQ